MGITKDGIQGEQKLFELLKSKGFKFFQPDAIGYKDGCYYVFEANKSYYLVNKNDRIKLCNKWKDVVKGHNIKLKAFTVPKEKS